MNRLRELLTRPFRLRVGGILALIAVAAIALEPKARAWRSPDRDEILEWLIQRRESLPTTPREKRRAFYRRLAADHRGKAEELRSLAAIQLTNRSRYFSQCFSATDEAERDRARHAYRDLVEDEQRARSKAAFHAREASRCDAKAEDNSPVPREDADLLVDESEAIEKEREQLVVLLQERRLRLAEERAIARKPWRLWPLEIW